LRIEGAVREIYRFVDLTDDRAALDNHLPAMRVPKARIDADRRLPVLLRMRELLYVA
jgi:hypothetical protein